MDEIAEAYQAASLLVYSNSAALQAIALPEFQSAWRALVHKCPWSTALQTPEFVCTWYEGYADLYQPLVLVRYAPSGDMDGLMALAIERASGKLTFAGAHQAEYNVWLALPGEQTFIAEALGRLRQLGFSSVSFTYLPPGVPLEWLKAGWSGRSIIRTVPKPLLTVGNADAIRESLSKKKNRRRLEKLQVDQPLSFLELRKPDELEAYYDEIIDFYDFRMGAIHGMCPFREDRKKRSFYKGLMVRGGLLHVTVMKIGQQLVAAHIGIRNKNEVMLGIVVHSPFLAVHSPGKLHILQLGLLLHEQGFSSLDLTPGGDAYKEDRATRYDEAYALTIFLDRKGAAIYSIAASVRHLAKAAARILHLDREKISRWRFFVGRAANSPIHSVGLLFRSVRNRIWRSTEMRFYRVQTKDIIRGSSDAGVRRDCLRDLLAYEPAGQSCRSKQEFLSNAMSRIESGVHSYSIECDDVLVSYGWLITWTGKSFINEGQHTYEYSPNSAIVEDFCTHPRYRKQGLCSRLLGQILRDAAALKSVEFVYVAIAADNRAARRAVEKAGFKYQDSIICDVRFGSEKIRVAVNSA